MAIEAVNEAEIAKAGTAVERIAGGREATEFVAESADIKWIDESDSLDSSVATADEEVTKKVGVGKGATRRVANEATAAEASVDE